MWRFRINGVVGISKEDGLKYLWTLPLALDFSTLLPSLMLLLSEEKNVLFKFDDALPSLSLLGEKSVEEDTKVCD